MAICVCFPTHILKPSADDVFCGTPPLAFTFGLGGMLCFPMRYGASTVLVEKHMPELWKGLRPITAAMGKRTLPKVLAKALRSVLMYE